MDYIALSRTYQEIVIPLDMALHIVYKLSSRSKFHLPQFALAGGFMPDLDAVVHPTQVGA